MKSVTIEIKQDDYDYLRDNVYEALDIEPTKEDMDMLWSILPNDIRHTAAKWGFGDTEFGDQMITWLQENRESALNTLGK